MDSKTKIVVLHTKELIYTAVFALLCILLIVLLFVMFGPGHTDKKQTSHKQYTPGTYTSTLTLNNTNLEVEVSVDSSRINSIRQAVEKAAVNKTAASCISLIVFYPSTIR